MTRRDEVLALQDRGRSTRQIAAELGISQTRVCQLLNTTHPNTVQPVVVQPGAVTANTVQADAVNTTHPNTVQQLTAERDELLAKMTALRPQWDALQAENRTLREQLTAANEELREAAPAVSSGTCRQHGTALIPLCPRCQGLDPDA